MDAAQRADLELSASLPPCPQCAKTYVRVWKRMSGVYLLRCDLCPHVWSVPKPGAKTDG
jgi:hypothetical protein